MRGIDWDKVRRNRKVWNPDYRENFKEARALINCRSSRALNLSRENDAGSHNARNYYTQPKTAKEIRLRLSLLGLKGKKLKDTTNEILTGKTILAWVECEVQVEEFMAKGYEMLPLEHEGKTATMRLVKRSEAGNIVEDVVFSFRKP